MRLRVPPIRQIQEDVVFGALKAVTRILRALPSRWILGLAHHLGQVLYTLDARGRRVGRQNLRVFFGDTLTRHQKRRILLEGMRGSLRSVFVTLHASPLTPDRVRRWVDVPEDVENTLREGVKGITGAVIVSGHLGNWEILLGLAGVFQDLMATTFLFEPNNTPGVDPFLVWLRGSGSGAGANRKGGALALSRHVKRGGAAGLLVDRNVKRRLGGLWVPFCGLDACTTPLPAFLSKRHGVPVVPLFCLPIPGGRYRIELGPRLDEGVDTGEANADIHEITRRINALMESMIRKHPSAWNWTLKRFKSRRTRTVGAYPPYSIFDPE